MVEGAQEYAEIIGKLNREVNAILAEPQMKASLASLGSSPAAELCKLIAEEIENWRGGG
jgi:hypothetical protein